MRAKVLIGLSLAVVAAILLTVVAVAGGTTKLPTVTPGELLGKMSAAAGQTTSISGEVSWTNDLLGTGALGQLQSGGPAQSPLTGSGSGRVWLSTDGLRLESQSNGGDQVTVVSTADKTAWVYDSAGNTVKKYVVTGTSASTTSPTPSPSPSMLTPSQMDQLVQQAAQYATATVEKQTTVAGQEAYILRLTPAAGDTALGRIEVAVDGKTYVPLRLQVFAAGATEPTLSFGFDRVSYGAIDASRFAFTPPAGATVTTKQIDATKLHQESGAGSGGTAENNWAVGQKQLGQAQLTVDQAQRLAGFTLATAQGYDARPLRWASVIDKGGPLTAAGTPLAQLLGGAGVQSGSSGPTQQMTSGPVAVLVYGKGFGTIVLAETKTTSQLDAQLSKLPQIGSSLTVGGHPAKMLATPLGGVIVWQDGGRTLAAFGMVTSQDLQAFAAAVR